MVQIFSSSGLVWKRSDDVVSFTREAKPGVESIVECCLSSKEVDFDSRHAHGPSSGSGSRTWSHAIRPFGVGACLAVPKMPVSCSLCYCVRAALLVTTTPVTIISLKMVY